MDVGEILTNFYNEIGITAPTSFFNATNTGVKQVVAHLYATCRDLRQARAFPQCKKRYSFATEASRTKYPLPKDFYSALPRTQFDRNLRRNMVGPLNDGEFNTRLYGFSTGQTDFGFRIFGPDMNPNTAGGQFEIDPSPSSVVTLSYDYITKNLFLPPNWTPSTSGITVGKYRNANGNIYKASAITTGTTGTTPPSHTTGTAVDSGVTWLFIDDAYETILSDDDLCMFDDDIVILGLKAKWSQAKGLAYEALERDFIKKIGQASRRWGGTFVGKMDRPAWRGPRYSVPDGGWL